MKTTMRTSILALAALALTLAACSGKDADAIALPSPTANGPTATPLDPPSGADPAAKPAAAASETAIAAGVPYTGTIEPHRRSTMMPKIPSTVVKVHVREGDRVKKGEPLVTFDTESIVLNVRQARAGLEGARIQRDATKLEFDRTKALVADKAAPQVQGDAVDFKMRGPDVSVTAAEIAVAQGEKALRDLIIRAPYDGLVIRRMINEGEYATAMPPTPLVVLEETAILDLRVLVGSSEMDRVQVGDPVTVSFPSLGTSIQTAVTRVVPTIDPRTRTFSAIIEIPNPDGKLRSGLFAEARFEKLIAKAAPAPAPAPTPATTPTEARP